VYLLADLRTHTFDLMQPSDCRSFSVRVIGQGDLNDLAQTLDECGVVEGDHVWVDVDVVRRLALFSTAQGWDADFAGMVDYARTKGWLDDDGGRIRAHIEWPGAD
jgi:hypothetical protein